MSRVKKIAHQSFGTREDTGQDLPGGGSTVRCNAKLRDMDIAVSSQDERAIKVLALGLPLHHRAQLAVDVTLRCALTTNFEVHPNAAAEDDAVCSRARVDKESNGATKPFSSSTILRRPDQGSTTSDANWHILRQSVCHSLAAVANGRLLLRPIAT